MVSYVNKHYPDCSITWVCSDSLAPLLNSVQGLAEVITVSDFIMNGSPWQKIRGLLKIWGKLFFRSFDRAVVAHADPRYRLITLPVKAKVKRFFSRDPQKRVQPIPGRYQGDDYLRLIDDREGPIVYGDAENFPALRLPPLSFPAKGVVLAPGGSTSLLGEGAQRQWPLANYEALARALMMKGLPVTIVGTEEFLKQAFQGLAVNDLLGKTDLLTLCLRLKEARLVVSHDTGVLHVARLVGTPVVGLFGPTLPFEMGGKKSLLLWKGETLACAPCYDGKRYARCSHNLCMEALTVDFVLSQINRFFGDCITRA